MIDVRIVRVRCGRDSDSLCLEYTPAVYLHNGVMGKKTSRERLGITIKAEALTLYDLEYNSRMFQIAEEIRQERLEDIRRGLISAFSPDESFTGFYASLISEKRYNISAGYAAFCKFCGGGCSFAQVTDLLCAGYRDHLMLLASVRRIRRSTADAYYRQFCMVVRLAAERGLPCGTAVLPDSPAPEREASFHRITMDELVALMDSPCPDETLRSIVSFTVLTGLRTGEILSLRWEGFHTDAEGRRFVSVPVKGKRKGCVKTVLISDEAAGCLPDERRSGLVFPRFSSHKLCVLLTGWASAAGIGGRLTLESFRHLRKDSVTCGPAPE